MIGLNEITMISVHLRIIAIIQIWNGIHFINRFSKFQKSSSTRASNSFFLLHKEKVVQNASFNSMLFSGE